MKAKKKYKVIAVIPAFNEEKRIQKVVNETEKHVDSVVVVNDCSTDNTREKAQSTAAEVIHLAQNKGVGYATLIGCEKAIDQGADLIVTLDADGQHAPDDIPGLLELISDKNLDIVFGSRLKNETMPGIRRFGNYILSLAASILFGIKIHDILTGFHAFRVSSFHKIRWKCSRYEFISEFIPIIYKNNLKYGEARIKTIYYDKKDGMQIIDGIRSVVLLLLWRFDLSTTWILKE